MTFEPLGGTAFVAVDDICRVGEDALLLARFAAPTARDLACDLGTGNAVIPLYWCRHKSPAHITAVEREQAFVALADASIERSGVHDTITLLHADWGDEAAMPSAKSMTLVTCNPPYFPFGASRPSPDPLRRAARSEDHPAMLDTLCRAASRLLTDDGRFCLCHRPAHLPRVLAAVQTAGLLPVRLQFVQAHDKAAPWLFLLESRRSGTLQVLPPHIRQHVGTHTAVYKKLYR